MTHDLFSIVARQASPRRLEVAEATDEAKPITANARKNKRKKGDVNKRCKQQAEDWRAFVPTFCQASPLCEILAACTTPLTVCDFTGFLVCLAAGSEIPPEEISLR
jgi:hypothetical protein